ncbi:MAG: hypothetical protein A3J29_16040 [Acidobacteria bacterium RIFCSPLOWO2_12_FULL_67_14b]|nr:MAG: hypothetical protein A3J29_16040 [Acidobacteria bacterium RIFCSPLOWO2_12_FULL_67_14b]
MLASIEQTVVVQDQNAADRRDNGFTQTLTQDEIDALPDDPDEMAEELARMAGPGAQIFVDGFRGGRLPPKDQIQQIRFHTNSFSAEYHEAGMIRVEVITKPGMGGWRGNTNFGFRDESLNARQAFADEKGPEQMRRYMVNFQGPIAKGKTGISLRFDGNSSYDSRTIVAQSPAGQVNSLAVAPTDAMNFSARVEHLIGGTNQIQTEYARRQNERSNIGVGDFDLAERAYATDTSTDTFRLRATQVIGKKVFSETRFEFNNTTSATLPGSTLPTIRVNEAFTAGGAGQSGDRSAREFEFAQNFDFTLGRKHSLRAGLLFESGWWESTQRSNANGTYTFTSLDAYRAGTPATYTIRTGDPLVTYAQTKAGWFVQDDFRPSRTLQLSVGLRQEVQTEVDAKWNLAPRAAFTWNATKKTTMRGGYGIFYDWYESNLHEQTIRVDGNHPYDSRTIVAQSPAGQVNSLAVAPTDAMNFSARVEHLIGGTNQIQTEYARRQNERSNIGVGDFDLAERAYATDTSTDTFRLRATQVIGKKVFSETRFEFNNTTSATLPGSTLPTIRVNEAFTAGGAGQSGDRSAREFEFAQNFDFTLGRKHSLRAGLLFESGWWESTQRSNANGTYTFTSLDAYRAGTPATYTIRTGDPLVTYAQTKAGWFVQDDFRPSRTLQLSVGLRQEVQTEVDAKWNLAPRAAFTWNATKKTTMRGGYGIFYDWYESNLHEQTIRVDGNHQVDVVIQNPGFPVAAGGGTRLPASLIRAASLGQPIIQQASFGAERPLAAWADFRADYMWTRGSNTLRSVNVNAPIDGVRPNPLVGNITEIQSSGRRASDRVTVALNARYIPRRILGMVMYQFGSSRNYADGPTSLPSNSNEPNLDWGPSAQDVRHRIFFNFNTPIGRGIRAGLSVQGSSALPYSITTGFDGNGDTVFNDRPAGVERNSARGASQWSANLRLNKSIGLGGLRAGPPMMPGMPPPPPPPPSGGVSAQRGPGGGGGDGPQMVVMEGGGNQKYRLDLYVNIQNVFNKVNYNAFVGNQLSSFFGTATSAGAPRRIEIGASLGF